MNLCSSLFIHTIGVTGVKTVEEVEKINGARRLEKAQTPDETISRRNIHFKSSWIVINFPKCETLLCVSL